MPCTCYYDPPEASKKLIKNLCKELVEEILRLNKEEDALGCEIQDVHKLIDHLYNPKICEEAKEQND